MAVQLILAQLIMLYFTLMTWDILKWRRKRLTANAVWNADQIAESDRAWKEVLGR